MSKTYHPALIAMSHDTTFEDDRGCDIFEESMLHEKITLVRDDMGLWWARIDVRGPGYMGHTFWRLAEGSLPDTLEELMRAAKQREREDEPQWEVAP